jgi:type I restriction-modification system DNA methylase subunit
MRKNNITGNIYSDEWYTTQDVVNIAIKLLDPEPNSLILCPFDSEHSLFVKTLEAMEHTVIYGIDDFIEGQFRLCDYIITNPPFSIKDKVIQKVYEYGVKSVLVMPLDALGGVKRHNMYKEYGYPSVYIPSRRISYIGAEENVIKGPSFHSIILSFNQGDPELIWEGNYE